MILTNKKLRLEQEMVQREYDVVSAGLGDEGGAEGTEHDGDTEDGRLGSYSHGVPGASGECNGDLS